MATLANQADLTHRVFTANMVDRTNEGFRFRLRGLPFGLQFHPEASPGPRDTSYLFNEFLS